MICETSWNCRENIRLRCRRSYVPSLFPSRSLVSSEAFCLFDAAPQNVRSVNSVVVGSLLSLLASQGSSFRWYKRSRCPNQRVNNYKDFFVFIARLGGVASCITLAWKIHVVSLHSEHNIRTHGSKIQRLRMHGQPNSRFTCTLGLFDRVHSITYLKHVFFWGRLPVTVQLKI